MKREKGKKFFKFTVGFFAAVLFFAIGVFCVDVSSRVTPDLTELTQIEPDTPMKNILDPDTEVRGVYIATVGNIDFPSKPGLSVNELKAELQDIIDTAKSASLNAVFFQVRPCGDALYKSEIFPTSEFLTGTQGKNLSSSFDPLEYLIEIAHEENIAVHAWINPLRVTYASASSPKHDTNALASNNPARIHPEYTVAYADGKLYYNPGIPEVRELIANGVFEVCSNYAVDGVIFDDYFYPYPVSGAEFDDTDTYKKYGKGFDDIEDFRRNNVNETVKLCYEKVKEANEKIKFGIAPFGIWNNDDGKNGGSDTNGLSSYEAIYCDTLAFIKGGYVDYVAPQIYWQFSTAVARYDVLTRWWNAQVSRYGTDVDLYISHAAYKSADWESSSEIATQVEFARSEKSYKGSIFYGYSSIKNNEADLMGQLNKVYEREIVYTDIESNGSPIVITTPGNKSYLETDATYILGKCDSAYPLFMDGLPVSLTKQGYFSVYVELKDGKNTFTFTQNGNSLTYVINKGKRPSSSSSGEGTATSSYTTLKDFEISVISPSGGVALPTGSEITLSVSAPHNSKVHATLGNDKIELFPTIKPKGDSKYYKEVYTATYKLKGNVGADEIKDLSNISYTVSRDGESKTVIGEQVRIMGKNAKFPVVVMKNDTELKLAYDSWFYDDFTPQSKGMVDYAVNLYNGYYKLRVGGYLDADGVEETYGIVPIAKVKNAYVEVKNETTRLVLETGINVPYNVHVDGDTLIFTIYNVDSSDMTEMTFKENPLFKSVSTEKSTKANTYKYNCKLIDVNNLYAFDLVYEDGNTVLIFENPKKFIKGDKPLTGKTIVVDPGHGGNDPGALGFDREFTEADINLSISLALKDKLAALGANVIITREDDSTLSINERIETLRELNPDVSVSVHQNSMDYSSDVTRIRGLIGLYFGDSGKMLTECISKATSYNLNRYERAPAKQRLALVRNAKFPSTLVEVGFITSAEEYELMTKEDGINLAAEGIANGIVDYFKAQGEFAR